MHFSIKEMLFALVDYRDSPNENEIAFRKFNQISLRKPSARDEFLAYSIL